MIEDFERIVAGLTAPGEPVGGLPLFDPCPLLAEAGRPADGGPAAAAAAFLVALGGPGHPAEAPARAILERSPAAGEVAAFFRRSVDLVRAEVRLAGASDPDLAERFAQAAERLADPALDERGTSEALWSAFFPEGAGVLDHRAGREAELRARRTVRLMEPADEPIADAARQVLFTSNVLLTVPPASRDLQALPYPPGLVADIEAATAEPQRHWFDHPIQVGVEPEANELLHGLRGLDDALAFESDRRPGEPIGRVPVVLSVTVTHDGLRDVARPYVEAELARSARLRHVVVHAFTESDTRRLVDEVLAPAWGGPESAEQLRAVFGVDGAYGRHYSFLKAVAALWQVVVDPGVRGTFKIDLDQVFPQADLVATTGRSALEHLASPLWGAVGVDAAGNPVELGMLAGALVNERDIGAGLFTPDVSYPAEGPALDEHLFFSRVPQALSTAVEMMERHDGAELNGRSACLQRVHVTGGTTGILVAALRRHHPFTPTFIGRAEDQAYLLSTLGSPGPRLACAHGAGLVMRHDKEAFAGEAIAAARVGKLIGDYVRILEFSGYAAAIAAGRETAPDLAGIKALLDPFTGCFVSRLPLTVTLLRFALRTIRFHLDGEAGAAREFAEVGARRLTDAIERTGDTTGLRDALQRERRAWDRYYEALDALEVGIRGADPAALALQRRGREIVMGCRVVPGST